MTAGPDRRADLPSAAGGRGLLPPGRLGGGLLGAAAGIAGITVLSRAVGFARVGVLSRTLGTSCVGSVYQAVNSVPNVVFEVVAGGALASLVVPVLAPAVTAGDRATAGRTAGALLSWALLLLLPVTVLGAVLAPLLVRLLVGADPTCPAAAAVGARLLVVFMPQVVLYGVGVVLTGVLQAHRRFVGPAVAPLLSSLVVIGAYLLYAGLGPVDDLRELSTRQELVLSVGTTLGVAVLSLSLVLPVRRLGLPLRPGLRFPPGVARRVRGLALAGVAGLAAQQLALLVALHLALGGGRGDAVVFAVATAVFLLPWAVLAVPVATSAFPLLAARAQVGQESAYAEVSSRALRAVLVLTLGAAAVLVAAADPVARVLVLGAPGVDSTRALQDAIVAFAPGLVGYGLLALLGRALYAQGDGRTPAGATVAGWLAVALADALLVPALPRLDRVVVLGLGNTLGMTLAGALLLLGLHRRAGAAAHHGATRAALTGITGALVALVVAAAVPVPRQTGAVTSAGTAVALAAAAAAAYLLVVRLLDPAGVRALLHGSGR